MSRIIAQNAGVDICKATLDVYLHPAAVARQFANDPKGIAALLRCWQIMQLFASCSSQPGAITVPSNGRLQKPDYHWPR